VSSLAELQSEFARALRDPALAPPPALGGDANTGASRRFDVYRNNMVVGLVDALRSAFPAVHRLVGEQYFAAAARVYIDRHPPESPVLLLYGKKFGDFLDSFPSASGVPYLGDVARLEWARANALHAADTEPASINKLTGVHEVQIESVALTLHPSLSVIRSRWPVVSLWAACLDTDHGIDVDMHASEHAVVVRPWLKVRVHVPPAGASDFLAGLERGAALGDSARSAMDADEAFDLAAQLQFVFDIGAVAAVNLPEQQNHS
jgi:hypothetical protein